MIKKNKSGVSLMISYVLLVFITISLSIGVYIWLKDYAVISEKTNCKEGTSLIIESYSIEEIGVNKIFNITIKNNGLFNVNGFLISAGNDSKKVPMQLLLINPPLNQDSPGYFDFEPELVPGQKTNAEFRLEDLDKLEIIQMQPYIDKEGSADKIFCEQALIKQVILINPSLIPGLVSWWKFDGNTQDSFGNNNGLIQGSPSYVPGRLNQGLNFNGVDESVNSTFTQLKTTIGFWYKNSTVLDWTHVVRTDGVFYVNGVTGGLPEFPVYVSGSSIYIGKTSTSNFFEGTIDEVAVYNRKLSEWEILQLYNSYNITG